MNLTVITINYNDANGLLKTIKSVERLKKKFSFQYIVVDGASSDESLKVMSMKRDIIDISISEPDSGVYYAMNKGIEHALGDWICMMNSGDVFHHDFELNSMFNNDRVNNEIKVLYGLTLYSTDGVVRNIDINEIRNGLMPFCHQSCFIRKEFFYDVDYKIYSDFDLISRIFSRFGFDSFMFINQVVAIYAGGGISSKISSTKRYEKYKILFRDTGLLNTINVVIRYILKK